MIGWFASLTPPLPHDRDYSEYTTHTPAPETPQHNQQYSRAITLLAELNPVDFFFQYLIPNKPVLIGQQAIAQWPACTEWVMPPRPHGANAVAAAAASTVGTSDTTARSANVAALVQQYGAAELVPLSHCIHPSASLLGLPDESTFAEYAAYLSSQQQCLQHDQPSQPPTVPPPILQQQPCFDFASTTTTSSTLPTLPPPPQPSTSSTLLESLPHPIYLKDWHAALLDECGGRPPSTTTPTAFGPAGDWLNEYCRDRKSTSTDDFRFVRVAPYKCRRTHGQPE